MRKNRVFALIFRSFAFLFCLAGIMDNLGVFKGEFHADGLLYYTVQSNILVLVFFAFATYKTASVLKKEGKTGACALYPRCGAGVLLAIMLTLTVFWFMLVPNAASGDGSSLLTFSNLSVHLFTPLLALADYIMFSEGGALKKRDPWLFYAAPFLYFIEATIAGFIGASYGTNADGAVVRFPYFFMDYDALGWLVAFWAVALTLVYVGAGFLMLYIDGRRQKRYRNST